MARFMLTALVVLAIGMVSVRACDPELTTDFFVPEGLSEANGGINGEYFRSTLLEEGVQPAPAWGQFGVTKVFSNKFTALTGLGIAAALLEYTPWSINPHHTHPRGTELLYVISGWLNVGLIDTNNTLFQANITAGDLYVFPKGLVHYQINLDCCKNATAISSFSSSNPGLVSLPSTLFGTGVPTDILTQAFGVSSDVITQLVDAQTKT